MSTGEASESLLIIDFDDHRCVTIVTVSMAKRSRIRVRVGTPTRVEGFGRVFLGRVNEW